MTTTGTALLSEMCIDEARKKAEAFVSQKDARIAKLESALRDIRSRTIDDVARDIAHKALGEK